MVSGMCETCHDSKLPTGAQSLLAQRAHPVASSNDHLVPTVYVASFHWGRIVVNWCGVKEWSSRLPALTSSELSTAYKQSLAGLGGYNVVMLLGKSTGH